MRPCQQRCMSVCLLDRDILCPHCSSASSLGHLGRRLAMLGVPQREGHGLWLARGSTGPKRSSNLGTHLRLNAACWPPMLPQTPCLLRACGHGGPNMNRRWGTYILLGLLPVTPRRLGEPVEAAPNLEPLGSRKRPQRG